MVTRQADQDVMTLNVETKREAAIDAQAIASTLREITKLGGSVAVAAPGELPNDGKIVADERDYTR